MTVDEARVGPWLARWLAWGTGPPVASGRPCISQIVVWKLLRETFAQNLASRRKHPTACGIVSVLCPHSSRVPVLLACRRYPWCSGHSPQRQAGGKSSWHEQVSLCWPGTELFHGSWPQPCNAGTEAWDLHMGSQLRWRGMWPRAPSQSAPSTWRCHGQVNLKRTRVCGIRTSFPVLTLRSGLSPPSTKGHLRLPPRTSGRLTCYHPACAGQAIIKAELTTHLASPVRAMAMDALSQLR